MKKCPFCAEDIQDAAIVCRFCNRDLATGLQPSASRTSSPGVAAVLGVIVPGLGHVYKGHIGAGLFLFVFTVIAYTMFLVAGVIVHALTIAHAYREPSAEEQRAQRTAERASLTAARDVHQRTLTPEQRTARSAANRSAAKVLVAWCAGIALFLAVVYAIEPWIKPWIAPTSSTSSADVSTVTSTTDDGDWNEKLRQIAASNGHPCPAVVSAVHEAPGASPYKGGNVWTIRCQNGAEYSILLRRNEPPQVSRAR